MPRGNRQADLALGWPDCHSSPMPGLRPIRTPRIRTTKGPGSGISGTSLCLCETSPLGSARVGLEVSRFLRCGLGVRLWLSTPLHRWRALVPGARQPAFRPDHCMHACAQASPNDLVIHQACVPRSEMQHVVMRSIRKQRSHRQRISESNLPDNSLWTYRNATPLN